MSRREGEGYSTPTDFRRALDDRLKRRARVDGLRYSELRRRFVLECYLARVFSLSGDDWVLKGGSGLAVRFPGARHTKDLDLVNRAEGVEASAAIDALRQVGTSSDRDPFVFTVIKVSEMTGGVEGHRLTVSCTLGGRLYEDFPIDLALKLDFVGDVETIDRALPIDITGIQPAPPMRLYPLVDQISDKVAAMYETHRGQSSSRYRDLVDLVLIATAGGPVDPEALVDALRLQQLIRGIDLPEQLVAPAPSWSRGYRAEAQRAGVEPDLDVALATAGVLVNPALARLDP